MSHRKFFSLISLAVLFFSASVSAKRTISFPLNTVSDCTPFPNGSNAVGYCGSVNHQLVLVNSSDVQQTVSIKLTTVFSACITFGSASSGNAYGPSNWSCSVSNSRAVYTVGPFAVNAKSIASISLCMATQPYLSNTVWTVQGGICEWKGPLVPPLRGASGIMDITVDEDAGYLIGEVNYNTGINQYTGSTTSVTAPHNRTIPLNNGHAF